MRNHLKHFLMLAVLTICFTATAVAQGTVKGKVVDAENNEPLIGATVSVSGTTLGTVTDIDGNFVLKVTSSKATLEFKYLGYQDKTMKLTQKGDVDLGTIGMGVDAHTLGDVIITSSIAVQRKTPVAVSTVAPDFLEEKIGTQELPEILKSTPGVFATKGGGGYGDSKLNIRGFQGPNVAVMINGISMNDMEWGGVYWSNWTSLMDVARSMQSQRGLGAAKVSSPSVGGSINIVTRTTDAKKGGFVSYGITNDGGNRLLFSVSTGMTKTGWAMTLLAGKKWGDGYIQGTDYEDYNYFLNISKRLNDAHTLSFTALGATQEHYQRSNYDGLTIEGWQQVKNYMKGKSEYRYNPTYGFGKNGERKSSAFNHYHKPHLSLNHQWQINEKSSLSTSLYASLGMGGGYKGMGYTSDYANRWYGSSNGVLNTYYRNADGTFAYDQIQDLNEQSETGSLMAMADNKNSHNWYGLLSNYSTRIGEYIDFYGGLDVRYYKGIHKAELNDLYNGKYFVDRYRADVDPALNSAASDPNWVNQKLSVGDVVYRNYDGYVMSEGIFAQAEYNRDKLSAFVAGSVSNRGYWRVDRFYYDKAHEKSKTVNFWEYTAKLGANYNLDEHHNVFFNTGIISRAPFFSGGAFLSSQVSHATNPNAINEKVFSAELGYGYRSRMLTVNFNAYYTKWLDKTMTRTLDLKDGDHIVDRFSINMEGVNARHMGAEVDLIFKPYRWVDITAMFSYGDWQWDSNATGYWYNEAGQPVSDNKGTIASGIQAADHAKSSINLKGVKVGGSAQTTAAFGANFLVNKDIRVGLDYNLYGRNYADFSFSGSDLAMNGETKFATPWKAPSGGQFDLNASYKFKIGSCNASLIGNVNNLFDQDYIIDSYNGDGTWQGAYRVFYAFGRTYSVKLKVSF